MNNSPGMIKYMPKYVEIPIGTSFLWQEKAFTCHLIDRLTFMTIAYMSYNRNMLILFIYLKLQDTSNSSSLKTIIILRYMYLW